MNQRACEFFERAYGTIEARTKRKIRFTETPICNYSRDVLAVINYLNTRATGSGEGESALATDRFFQTLQQDSSDDEVKWFVNAVHDIDVFFTSTDEASSMNSIFKRRFQRRM